MTYAVSVADARHTHHHILHIAHRAHRRQTTRLFYVQFSVCGEKRLLSFQTNQLASIKSVLTLK